MSAVSWSSLCWVLVFSLLGAGPLSAGCWSSVVCVLVFCRLCPGLLCPRCPGLLCASVEMFNLLSAGLSGGGRGGGQTSRCSSDLQMFSWADEEGSEGETSPLNRLLDPPPQTDPSLGGLRSVCVFICVVGESECVCL